MMCLECFFLLFYIGKAVCDQCRNYSYWNNNLYYVYCSGYCSGSYGSEYCNYYNTPKEGDGALTVGAIVGIVVGVLCAFTFFIVIIVVCVKSQMTLRPNSVIRISSGMGNGNTTLTGYIQPGNDQGIYFQTVQKNTHPTQGPSSHPPSPTHAHGYNVVVLSPSPPDYNNQLPNMPIPYIG